MKAWTCFDLEQYVDDIVHGCAVLEAMHGIAWAWQDKMNAQGGHFQFQLKPNVGGGQAGRSSDRRWVDRMAKVDEYWLGAQPWQGAVGLALEPRNNLVLGMIGATIEPANMITGLRLVTLAGVLLCLPRFPGPLERVGSMARWTSSRAHGLPASSDWRCTALGATRRCDRGVVHQL